MSALTQRIPEDLKAGRDLALLGNYDSSLVYYEGVNATLQKQLSECRGAAREQWNAVGRSPWQQARG